MHAGGSESSRSAQTATPLLHLLNGNLQGIALQLQRNWGSTSAASLVLSKCVCVPCDLAQRRVSGLPNRIVKLLYLSDMSVVYERSAWC